MDRLFVDVCLTHRLYGRDPTTTATGPWVRWNILCRWRGHKGITITKFDLEPDAWEEVDVNPNFA